ncbi:DUF4430 domain-containing protein [uncultured Gemmiger sp.]|uniref:DUF4430 domain-containing protein n=1 Tax=uncultured Gemmiger sp. TaxID=1623490 RepID=UPI0025DC305B|nr:DUF4430 domain-containing protein [uncultured Gemmiger sp.]
MKMLNKVLSVAVSAAMAAMLLAGCGASASSAASSEAVSSEVVSEAATAESSDSDAKVHATFTVVNADGNSTDIDLEVTDGEKLSNALAEAGVISQDEADAGFVTTVNGVTADYNADGAWWCLTDATGEMTTVGVADIELHDGDSYAFTYTK